ncbi:DNA-binding response regulator [Spirosoma taeanense]|uniref:DNA-binding response regulator n=1 Tax=Spirosoma taeanense TaxID=2735870 RepID=A0A6M5YAQ2_9BACT|nr:LytTR family DNA-binding domain-containing protein [Spirosoma taeanense]QJW91055.1 DNA-binding response regulator [Spirosoma taeanense]
MNYQQICLLIIDDDEQAALDLKLAVDSPRHIVIGIATTMAKALAIFEHQRVDIVLVSSSSNSHNGVRIARQLDALRAIPVLILTDQPVTGPIDSDLTATYLVKSVSAETVRAAIDKALTQFNQRLSVWIQHPSATNPESSRETILQANDQLFIKQNYQFIRLPLAELIYLEADASYTTLVTTTRKYVLRLTLHALLKRLSWPSLVRVHRSYAVNVNRIDFFSSDEVNLCGQSIPLGRSYKDEFLQQFMVR